MTMCVLLEIEREAERGMIQCPFFLLRSSPHHCFFILIMFVIIIKVGATITQSITLPS